MEEKNLFEVDIENKKFSLAIGNNKLFSLIGDKIDNLRWNGAIKFYDKYTELSKQRKMEGKRNPIPPKYVLEIFDNAILEDDETLRELWARLLVNWEDPRKKLDMKSVYISIIKSLSPVEVKILNLIEKDIETMSQNNTSTYGFISEDYYDFRNIHYFISHKRIVRTLNLTEEEYVISMLNLFRCMCIESIKVPLLKLTLAGENPIFHDYGLSFVKPTYLGENLIKNCIGN